MRFLGLVLLLAGCTTNVTNVYVIGDLGTEDRHLGEELPDLAAVVVDAAGGNDLAVPGQPDLAPACGLPSSTCCPTFTCDQPAAHDAGWFGAYCAINPAPDPPSCRTCGSAAFDPCCVGGGCASPLSCRSNKTCMLCGKLGQPCCTSLFDPKCDEGTCSSSSTCQ